MNPIFKGIRVLDLGRFVAAPYAATLLGDYGAEVIRVERSGGDDDRTVGLPSATGDTFLFLNVARKKKAITLNYMTNKKALDVLMELTRKSDVVVQNFTSSIAKQVGIDYEKMSAVNPRIVYYENSAFGSTGPYADRLGFDPLAQAISGLMAITGFKDLPPLRTPFPFVDFSTAVLGAFGIASALYQRTVTGKGSKVETSLLKTAVAINSTALSEYEATGKIRTRKGNTGLYAAPADSYQTKDGRWIIVLIVNAGHFKRFCSMVKREDLLARKELMNPYNRYLHKDELETLTKEWVGARTAEEVEAEFRKARIPCCRVYEIPEVLKDPQVISQEAMVDVDCREAGQVKLIGTPVRLGEERPDINFPPPRLGEHNREIYCGLLGYSESDLARLKEEGII